MCNPGIQELKKDAEKTARDVIGVSTGAVIGGLVGGPVGLLIGGAVGFFASRVGGEVTSDSEKITTNTPRKTN